MWFVLRWYWAGEFPETTGTGGKVLGLMLVLGAAMPVGKDETNISAWLMDVDDCWWWEVEILDWTVLQDVTRATLLRNPKWSNCAKIIDAFLKSLKFFWLRWAAEATFDLTEIQKHALKTKYIIYRSYYRKDLQSKWKFKNCDLTPGGIARKGPSFTLLHASALCFCHWGSTGVCSAMLLRGA